MYVVNRTFVHNLAYSCTYSLGFSIAIGGGEISKYYKPNAQRIPTPPHAYCA